MKGVDGGGMYVVLMTGDGCADIFDDRCWYRCQVLVYGIKPGVNRLVFCFIKVYLDTNFSVRCNLRKIRFIFYYVLL